jgi:hypothetical protein
LPTTDTLEFNRPDLLEPNAFRSAGLHDALADEDVSRTSGRCDPSRDDDGIL